MGKVKGHSTHRETMPLHLDLKYLLVNINHFISLLMKYLLSCHTFILNQIKINIVLASIEGLIYK